MDGELWVLVAVAIVVLIGDNELNSLKNGVA